MDKNPGTKLLLTVGAVLLFSYIVTLKRPAAPDKLDTSTFYSESTRNAVNAALERAENSRDQPLSKDEKESISERAFLKAVGK